MLMIWEHLDALSFASMYWVIPIEKFMRKTKHLLREQLLNGQILENYSKDGLNSKWNQGKLLSCQHLDFAEMLPTTILATQKLQCMEQGCPNEDVLFLVWLW